MWYIIKRSFLPLSASGSCCRGEGEGGGEGDKGPPERNKNDDLDEARHFNLFAQMSFSELITRTAGNNIVSDHAPAN